jgi:hypothetical protein
LKKNEKIEPHVYNAMGSYKFIILKKIYIPR